MKAFILGLMSLMLGLMLVGCGGGSSAASAKGAAVVFTVKWPARVPSRVIPNKTQSVKVVLTANGSTQTQILARPDGNVSTTATFTNVAVGAASLVATAYPNADGTGTALATASSNFNVAADTPFNVTVTLDSTITHLKFVTNPANVGNALTVSYPNTATLAVQALDAGDNLVMYAPSEMTITSSDSTTASIDANGLITTLKPGPIQITAHESSSGITAVLNFTVGDYVEGNFNTISSPRGRIVLDAIYQFDSNARAIDWYVDFPRFTKIDGQTLQSEGFGSAVNTGTPLVNPPTLDLSTDTVLGRPVIGFGERVSAPNGTSLFFAQRQTISFQIARNITPGFIPISTPDLTNAEKTVYSSVSSVVDFNSVAFQAWLTTNNLFRQPNETSVALAKRIADAMHTTLAVQNTSFAQSATDVINAGSGNCHGLAAVMVGALRANGIYARVNCGANVQSTFVPQAFPNDRFDPKNPANWGFGREYSTAQMYHRMAGWIRVDGQRAAQGGANTIGTDDGNVIALAVGEDFTWKHSGTDIPSPPDIQLNHVNTEGEFFMPHGTVWTDGFQVSGVSQSGRWVTTRD